MRRNFINLAVFILLLLTLQCSGQHDSLVNHWSFDGDISQFERLINGEELKPALEKGVSGKGFWFTDNYLEIKDGVDLTNEFTLSFWFKPSSIQDNQTLFYQFRQVNGKNDIRNFIRLEIEDEVFSLKSEKGRFGLRYIKLVENSWYTLSYMYDGNRTKLYLQGQLIYETNEEISFYGKSNQSISNRLFIGRSHTAESQFTGVVDEIKVYQKAVEDKKVTEIYEEFKDEVEVAPQIIKNENQVSDIVIRDTTSSKVGQDSKSVNDVVVVDKYEVLEPLVVQTRVVSLEYYLIKGEDCEMVVLHNDESDKILLSNEKRVKRIFLSSVDENSLTFEGFELKSKQKCKVRVNIKSNSNIIASYDFDLAKNNVVIPVAYLKSSNTTPRNHKIITVDRKDIEIQVKDNSKVDGDVITIVQDERIILEDYTLTGEFENVTTTLKENEHNEFTFIPIDMGSSSGENTALVLILVDGEVIYDFSLRSVDKNRPAKLTIIHENF